MKLAISNPKQSEYIIEVVEIIPHNEITRAYFPLVKIMPGSRKTIDSKYELTLKYVKE